MEMVKVLPYEVVVRFCCEIGETAGAIRGIHAQQLAFTVDDGGTLTGVVQRGTADLAKDFPQDQLTALIGSAAVATDAIHKDALDALNKTLSDVQASLVATQTHLAEVSSARDDLGLAGAQVAHPEDLAHLLDGALERG